LTFSAPFQPKPRRRLLQRFFSQEPADQLLRQTARQQWRLIAMSVGSSVVVAFSEVATLGLVFLAVQVLSAPVGQSFNWASTRLQGWWPAAAAWLNGVPPMAQFLGLLGLALLVQALISLASFLNQVCIGYFSARCKALVTARIHRQVLQLSFPCASGYKVGDLTDYAAQGPEAIRIKVEQSSALLVGLLMMAAYLVTIVSISPWLLLAVMAIGLLITLLQKRLLPRIRSGSKAVADTQVAISSRITEDFQGLRLLHSTGLLEMADRRLVAVMGELEGQLRGQARRLAVVGPFSSFLPILAITVLVAISVLLLGGRSTGVLPSLVTFVLALQKLSGRINMLSINFNTLADNSGRYKRLNAILSPQGKQFRRLGGAPINELKKEIRFEGVSLQYAPELPPALREISFTLAKGQMLALVGPSGAGKSSIADLLTGLYAPTQGRILIDSTPIEQLELASWQQRLGVVSQDTFLFNATIAENIAIGSPGATPAQIESACRAAQAAGFIECLPNGYNTFVGERGFRLSGGQRQRLSLARAILREPELLILDEATSALDSQSERLVQEAIEQFERNHTVLVIAHRLSTIVHADQILVLEGGRVVERGHHSTLLARQGLYAQLWHQQSQAGQPALT
jgi:ATP-binding cassette, subfamily B, bacterial MsbA